MPIPVDINDEFGFTPKPGSSGFLKLADGETVTLRIVSETYYRQNLTIDDDLVKRGDYTDEQWAKMAEDPDIKKSDRFIWGVWVRRSDKDPAKNDLALIFECGPSIYNAVKTLAVDPDYGDPRAYDIKITRKGKLLETKYSVIPGKNTDDINNDEGNAVLDLDIPQKVKGARPLADVVKELSDASA